jgi:hypothetical protein
MSLSIRPVDEKWGKEFSHNLDHSEIMALLQKIAAIAQTNTHTYLQISARTCVQPPYGDCVPMEILYIVEGSQFLDTLSGGREEILKARQDLRHSVELTKFQKAAPEYYDLTDAESEIVDQLSKLVPAWRQSVDPGGPLVIYVDYVDLVTHSG